MKATVALCALLTALLSGSAGRAENTSSAGYVMVGCRHLLGQDDGIPLLQGVCAGSIQAVWEVAPGVCTPRGAPLSQAIHTVVQYIDAHPARLNESFAVLAAEALRAAWPCRKG
jgi:hypothetical protein